MGMIYHHIQRQKKQLIHEFLMALEFSWLPLLSPHSSKKVQGNVQSKQLLPIKYHLSHLPGYEIDDIYGSKWVSDELFKSRLSVFYCEVTRFKQTTLASLSVNNKIKQITTANRFTQSIADNVDNNFDSLDGRGTSHCMGNIASTVSKKLKLKRPGKLLKERN